MKVLYDSFDGDDGNDDEPSWSDLLPRLVLAVVAFAVLLIQLFV
jgi:hypothetical protein